MPERTSWEASITTSIAWRGVGSARFSLSRRKMFSTSTTASSTSSPMAMAMPPMVMVLIDIPNVSKTIMVIRIEIGIAVSEIIVVRTLSRNRNRMAVTTMMASISTLRRLPIEASMKCDCLKR